MSTSHRVASEAEIIERYLRPLSSGFAGAFDLADDCAVLAPPPGEELLVTVDALAEGVHYFPEDHPEDIAWKALAVNVSDLAGKGARPLAYVMSLAFPEAPQTDWLARFAAGLAEAQERFGLALIGGDTDRRPGPTAVTITAFGTVPVGAMVRRATGRDGDTLLVSGTLGDAALGLALDRQPSLATLWGLNEAEARDLRLRRRRPQPRTGLREALLGLATAAIDISDGLAKDLAHLARASGVSAHVRIDALPLSGAGRKALSAEPQRIGEIVAGGEDYEVLASVTPGQVSDFAAMAKTAGIPVTEIGGLASGSGVTLTRPDSSVLQIARAGYDHFAGSSEAPRPQVGRRRPWPRG